MGTLVRRGPNRFILTHDHWPIPSPGLIGVELRNSVGERLLLLDADTFLSLVSYRDGGTMILEAPEHLSGLVPAALGNRSDVVAGDTVWMAAYDPDATNSVRIVSARIDIVEHEEVPGKLQLRGPRNHGLALGDSGGGIWLDGIWLDGKLIGNLWSIVANSRAGFWKDSFGDNLITLSNPIFAALHPLDNQGSRPSSLKHPIKQKAPQGH